MGGGRVMVQFLGTEGLFSNETNKLRWSTSGLPVGRIISQLLPLMAASIKKAQLMTLW